MKEKKRKGFLNILIIICMVLVLALTINVLPAASAMTADSLQTFTDMPDNWAKEALEKAVANGLLLGDNGKIMPDSPLTRAQMATIIVRVFGAGQEGDISVYSDIKSSDWFAGSMAKALKMGVMQGYDGKMNPESNISREQAFAILARAMKVSPEEKLNKIFADAGSISDWAKGDVYALVNAGYIQGSGEKLNPQSNISRAEFAQIMYNIFKEYISTPGQYSQVAQGNIVVNVPGVSLKNLTVNGDLIVGDGVGDGDLKLDQVTIKGNLILRGGGINSIVIVGGSVEGKIIVGKVDGQIRVSIEGGADVETIFVDDGKDDVIIEGRVGTIDVRGDNINVIAKNADVKNAIISGNNSKIVLEEGSKIKEAAISGVSATILLDQGTSVDKIIISGKGANIEGKGDVKSVAVKSGGDNASIRTPNTEIKVDKGVIGTLAAGGVAVEGGISAKNNAAGNDASLSKPGTSENKTSSSGSTDIKVSAISISGTAQVGQTLTATANTEHVTYQWLRSQTTDVNGEYEEIGGATSKTYILDDADKDKYIKVKVKGIAGKATGEETSDPTAKVQLVDAQIGEPSETFYHNDEKDITATITWNSATKITKIITSGVELVENTDYTVAGNTLTIKKEYFMKEPISSSGATGFGVEFDRGSTVSLTVNIATKYQVVFDANDGSGTMDEAIAANDQVYTFPSNEFTPPGEKVFDKWKVKNNGTDEYYAEGATKQFLDGHVESDGKTIKIYAVWEDIPKYVVTFSVVDGNGSISATANGVAINSGDQVAESSNLVFTATPNTGYKIKQWKYNGTEYTGTETDLEHGPLGEDFNVTVEFEVVPLSNSKEITSFKFEIGGNFYEGNIDQPNQTIEVKVPYATDISALIPDIVHTGVSYSPATAQDFNSPVIYTVKAENGSEKEYSVTVTIAPVNYTVTYDLNTGSGTVPTESDKAENDTFTVSDTTGITPPTGKEFKEWNTKSDGTGTSYAVGDTVTMPASDLTLYAIWKVGALEIKNDTETTSGNKEDNLNTLGYHWDKGSKTLTIRNLMIEGKEGYGIKFSGFDYTSNITIDIEGDNIIEAEAGSGEGVNVISSSDCNLTLTGEGKLSIYGSSTGENFGVRARSLTVKDSLELHIKTNNGSDARSIWVGNDFKLQDNVKVEMESARYVVAAFGNAGKIYIEDKAKFKGIAHGAYSVLHSQDLISIGKDTKVELIRDKLPGESGARFFDYSSSDILTLAEELKLQGSENVDGSGLVDAKLYDDKPKRVVRYSDSKDVFKYVLIKAEETTKYDITVATVVGGTATVNVDKAKAAAGETVTVTITNIEAGKQVKSITVTDTDSGTVATTEVTAGASYTFAMPAKNATVEVEVEAVSVTQYDVTVATVVDGTADVTVDKAKAAAGETVTVTIENIGDGKELFDLTVAGLSKEDITETDPGKEFTFTMLASDVTVEVTVGVPETIKIGTTGTNNTAINLVNGTLKDTSENEIAGLSWSYFHNTLTMNNYNGAGIYAVTKKKIIIKVVSEKNKITNSDATFGGFGGLVITGEADAKLEIDSGGWGVGLNAFSAPIEVQNIQLAINVPANTTNDSVEGVYGSITVSGTGKLEINVEPTGKNDNKIIVGVGGKLTLKDSATAVIKVEGKNSERVGDIFGAYELVLAGTGNCEITVIDANSSNTGTLQAVDSEPTGIPTGYTVTGSWNKTSVKYTYTAP